MNAVCRGFRPSSPGNRPRDSLWRDPRNRRDLSSMNGHTTSDSNGDHASEFTALGGRGAVTREQMGRELSVRFDRGPSAASAARNALLTLEPRVDAQCLDDIRLLVSE